MSIKNKTIIISIIISTISLILVISSFSLVNLNYIDQLENKSINKNYVIVDSIIKKELSALESTSLDWAHWDDSYNFMRGIKAEEFTQTNLLEKTLNQLDINMMLFIDTQGRISSEKTVDIDNGTIDLINKYIIDNKNERKNILNFMDNKDIHSGILSMNGKLFLVVSSPITTTDESAKSNGSMIIGRYLDQSLIDYINKVTNIKVNFEYLNSSHNTYKNMDINKNNNSIMVYQGIKDINGNLNIKLTMEMKREELKQGYIYLRVIIITAILISGAILIFLIVISNKYLIKKLEALNLFNEKVSKTKDVSKRIFISGNDEITKIANSTNNMLASIEAANNDIINLNNRFRIIMEATNDGYLDYNFITKEFYISEEWKSFIGYSEKKKNQELFREYVDKLHPETVEETKKLFYSFIHSDEDYFEAEYQVVKASGDPIWVLHRGKVAERDNDGRALRIVSTLLDITRRKSAEAEILTLSFSDKLTGLKNRNYLECKLGEIDDKPDSCYSIIMADINGLKQMDDNFGHKEGDRLL